MNRSSIISIPGNRKKDSCAQVLHVHKGRFASTREDEHLPDGIYVCHASLRQVLNEETWINNKQIDAVLVGPDCSVADIISIREITTRKVVPLIFHTLKFDWKAKEISIESGVDEYHIGFLDHQFIKRIILIKRVKSLRIANPVKKNKRLQEGPSIQVWFLKRSLDIAIATLVILSLLPVLLIIVPLLMLETNGSILDFSKRVGKNYRAFDLYKFKCISSGDSKKINLIRHFLKKAHLVGLPQLLNVFVGDMSLVGNYPIHERDAETLTKDGIAWRFLAPAGITGLWRFGPVGGTETWKSDLEYATANSIWLDIKILCAHIINIVAGPHRIDNGLMIPAKEKSVSSNYGVHSLHVVH